MTFRLAYEGAPGTEIVGPTPVMKDASLTRRIIGSNLIGVSVNTKLKQSNTPVKHQLILHLVAPCPGSDTSGIQACVEKVSTEQTYEYMVKTTKEKLNVTRHTSVKVECRVQTAPFQKDTDLTFESALNPQRAEGLEFCDTLVTLRRGAKRFISIDVQIPTDHNILLTWRTVIGTVQ